MPVPGGVLWVHQLNTQGGWDDRAAIALDDTSIVAAVEFTGIANVGGSNLTSAGGEDLLLARFAQSDGSYQASVRFGGPGDEFPLGLAIAPDSSAFVSGIFANGTANLGGSNFTWSGNSDNGFFAEYDSTFTPDWSRAINSPDAGADTGHVVFIDSQARIYASGKFQGSPDFGNGAVTATAGGGNADGFFAQYSDGGVLGTFVPFNGPTAAHYAYAESAIYSAGSTIVGGSARRRRNRRTCRRAS
jgi:hypothetical protein